MTTTKRKCEHEWDWAFASFADCVDSRGVVVDVVCRKCWVIASTHVTPEMLVVDNKEPQ